MNKKINIMNKNYTLLLTLTLFANFAAAQKDKPSRSPSNTSLPDSVFIAVHPKYDKVNGFHRWLFGESFRKEWAAKVKLPVIDIKRIGGGLSPLQYGGGMETKSIRLQDKTGKEWVIRSVEKVPDKLVPENLRGTFVLDWVDDEYTGQHPFSALVVPPLAEAADVPHPNPVIGVLAPDSSLAAFGKAYANRVVLLEEREPTGKSENTQKTMRGLVESNNNRIDKEEFLRARLLDVLSGDWDRHEDQWRWTSVKHSKNKVFSGVPRDRDQVMHVNEGVFPTLASLPWLDPQLGNFDDPAPNARYSPLFKTHFIQRYPDAQFSYQEWMRVTNEFVRAESNQVLEDAVDRLPKELYALRHDELLDKLKKRRDAIPAIMSKYFNFINRVVDIQLSNENEQVTINEAPANGMQVVVERLNKNGKEKETIMDITYLPAVTKEIRVYISGGDDHVTINNSKSPILLRVIGTTGEKTYEVKQPGKRIQVYNNKDSVIFKGDAGRLSTHLSNDTSNTHFVPVNPYNVWAPLGNASINKDDGFLLGLGFKYTGKDGFRKLPYSTVQEFMITHSFETKAFRITYNGQWMEAIGKADFTLNTLIDAPDNTTNFFGEGNNTDLDKATGYHKYYRTRFDLYQFDPALRWHTGKGSTISLGPSFQYYNFDTNGNLGRAVNQPGLIHSYDSTNFEKQKAHGGLISEYVSDTKDSKLLPTKGYFLNIKLEGYTGLNNNAKSFAQLRPEFTFFQKVDSAARLVLSDRIGGGVSVGNPAFYQYMYLGGQGNLLGYLQNRFAGQQMAYNNLQARLRLANIGGYILPGQLGITGFYDVGRVWIDGEHSDTWHQGEGGGIYFAPATLTVIQIIAGHSNEGWYPYIAFNFRL
ncbi:MAG TPA: BamA/TamA family outer membrane protein [Mucilaginibacter sp.]